MMQNQPIFTLNRDKETNLVQSFDIAQTFRKYGCDFASQQGVTPEKPRISKHEDLRSTISGNPPLIVRLDLI
ncbi:hypothetical protein TSUD_360880 [Trifolium subterraneum]|uniref:Uncharacterized protein n=1 Tax=Trifolium subterraneum TaxID=3900 RepID=A0A2Z6MJI8_TRISU|nr:hypothetical protein TSUD_360880 [Trifolium subterraneum]